MNKYHIMNTTNNVLTIATGHSVDAVGTAISCNNAFIRVPSRNLNKQWRIGRGANMATLDLEIDDFGPTVAQT